MRKIVRRSDIQIDDTESYHEGDRNIGQGIPGGEAKIDNFATRLLKYIPAETVTGFASAQAIGLPMLQDKMGLSVFDSFFCIVGVFFVFNILYLLRSGFWQILGSTIAFAIWVLLIGDPVPEIFKKNFGEEFLPGLVGIALLGWTVFAPLFDRLARP